MKRFIVFQSTLACLVMLAIYLLQVQRNKIDQILMQLEPTIFEQHLEAWYREGLAENSDARIPLTPKFFTDEIDSHPYFFRFDEGCQCFRDEWSKNESVYLNRVDELFMNSLFKSAELGVVYGVPHSELSILLSAMIVVIFGGCSIMTWNLLYPGRSRKPTEDLQRKASSGARLKDFAYFTERVTRTIANPFVSHQCLIAIEPDVPRLNDSPSNQGAIYKETEHRDRNFAIEIEEAYTEALAKVCEHGPLPSVYKHPSLPMPVFLIHCPNYDSKNALSLVVTVRRELDQSAVKKQAQFPMFCAGVALWEHDSTQYQNESTETIEFVRAALGALKTAQGKGMGQVFVESVFGKSSSDFRPDAKESEAL